MAIAAMTAVLESDVHIDAPAPHPLAKLWDLGCGTGTRALFIRSNGQENPSQEP